MPAITELQEAAAITRVVWIDDVFAEPPDDALKVAIQAKLRIFYENKYQPKHDALKKIDIKAPEEIFDKQIQAVLNDPNVKLPGLFEYLKQVVKDVLHGEPNEDPGEDFTPSQAVGLRDSLENIEACSYGVWQSRRSEILRKADDRTLFLVDREFRQEGLADDLGDQIITHILSEVPKAYCIMFTHTVEPDDADAFRIEISKKIDNVEAHQFGVMSKRGLGVTVSDVTNHFSLALRMCLLCRFCCDVALEICDVMNEAARNAAKEMASFAVDTIDAAIFENSLAEGASEFDVVERILAVNQRVASRHTLAAKRDLFALLQRIRSIRSLIPIGSNTRKYIKGSHLHDWRLAEVFDRGEYVNLLHSPLRCGDVFRHTENGKRYVLLGQPCDLVVRGGGDNYGSRRRDEAELVVLQDGEPNEAKQETNFVIKGVGDHGESWLVKFREAFSVNLRVLDLAVYNSQGNVSWILGQKAPVQLLPGWQKRFRKTEQWLGNGHDPDAMGSLSHFDRERNLNGNFNESRYSFPLTRIGRIRSPYAEAIQASYAAFISRAALSHDFAKNLWAEEPNEQESD
jgi:hypothetical protein